MVTMLAHEIHSIPTGEATPDVQQHIRAVADWAATFPTYQREANAAWKRVYKQEKGYEGSYGNTGMIIGGLLAAPEDRGWAGTIGNMLGEFFNELHSQSAANAARAKVMEPCCRNAFYLAEAEHALNVRQGRPSTNHLRRLLGRY